MSPACLDCGGALAITYADHPYIENKVPNDVSVAAVLLELEFRNCLNVKCGCAERVIPHLAQLHFLIEQTPLSKRPLRLRHYAMGWCKE